MNTSEHEDDKLLRRVRNKAHRQGRLPAVARPDDLDLAEARWGFHCIRFTAGYLQKWRMADSVQNMRSTA